MISIGKKVKNVKLGFEGVVVDKKERIHPHKVYFEQKMTITPPATDGTWYTKMYLVKNPTEGSMWFEEKSLIEI
ncbi:hypothetical protein [Methanobacterium formicicum]|uniref:Uncharacterized protein n=1 Tax=Methanobacterium formicicum (strain DSM 3637 / PP1) TaxID=1204725 RepID=K2RAD6_METFP|nr:hypothetical protein [Methanobacterium formicicum]EKF85269.1 hypothetical protein A994_08931 [Methanobacterium formicicum DSM 3637]